MELLCIWNDYVVYFADLFVFLQLTYLSSYCIFFTISIYCCIWYSTETDSGSWLLASPHGDLSSIPDHVMCDLWWTKWHWDRVSQSALVSPINSHSSTILLSTLNSAVTMICWFHMKLAFSMFCNYSCVLSQLAWTVGAALYIFCIYFHCDLLFNTFYNSVSSKCSGLNVKFCIVTWCHHFFMLY
jgi:hypothetical protein